MREISVSALELEEKLAANKGVKYQSFGECYSEPGKLVSSAEYT